ncbi:MAG TPA: hypothetical protein VFN94_09150 [Nitrospiria bacterium]|nr:hypothetical protein [Nitrospiria bacterium]
MVAANRGLFPEIIHSTYSPRFGIGWECDAPEEAFMVIELTPGYLRGAPGKVRYHTAFSDVG